MTTSVGGTVATDATRPAGAGRVHPSRVAALVALGAVLALALTAVGRAIAALPADNAYLRWEEQVSRWFVSIRTPGLDLATHVGSYLAETVTCVVLLAIVMGALRVRLGRWRESWVVFAAIVGELLVFLAVTALVDRPRPDVVHLDAAPPTSSFPSGHTGAAVALYGCLAVLIWRVSSRGVGARLLVAVCCVVPVVVAVSRVYRGMHHVSDVVFGAVGGGVWLLVVLVLLLPRDVPRAAPEGADEADEADEVDEVDRAPSARGTSPA